MQIPCLVVFGLLTFLAKGWFLSLLDGQDELSLKSQDLLKDPKPSLPHQEIVKELSELDKERKHDMSRYARKATRNKRKNIMAVKNEKISENNKVKDKERKHRKSKDKHEGKPRKLKILKRIGELHIQKSKKAKRDKRKYKILYRNRKQKRNKRRRNKNKQRQCVSDVKNDCLKAAMDVYEFERKNFFFYKRQDDIYRFIAIIEKKLERKELFWDVAEYLQDSIGGDITNQNCSKSDAANKGEIETNYNTLLNCKANIQSACTITSDVWDKDTKDQLDKCVCKLNKKPSKDCHKLINDSEACKCWETEIDNEYKGAKECRNQSSETKKGIKKIKEKCREAFSACKDAKNDALSWIETCLVGEVRPNKAGYSASFEGFVTKYEKNYTSIEKIQRFAIWKKNTKAIEKHNKDGSKTYKQSENVMTDMRLSEIKSRYMGLTPVVPCFLLDVKPILLPVRLTFNQSVNWTATGAVTPVNDQKEGTCWAHSAVGALEAAYFTNSTNNRPLQAISVDYLIECDNEINKGILGGHAIYAFTHVLKNGIPILSEYEQTKTCDLDKSGKERIKIKDVTVYREDKDTLLTALQIGPVSAVMCATESFTQYNGSGIFSEPNCLQNCSWIPNHAVLIVGYGEESGGEYWLGKNSWGTSWGDQGYFKITRDQGSNCGIISKASSPKFGNPDIKCNATPEDLFANLADNGTLQVRCCNQLSGSPEEPEGQCVNVDGVGEQGELGGASLSRIGWDWLDRIIDKSNTVNSCIQHCKANGFYYAGLLEQLCYCGNPTPPVSTFRPKEECSLACPGNSGQSCGGAYTTRITNNWRLTVYTTGPIVECTGPNECSEVCGGGITCIAPVDSLDEAKCNLYNPDETLALVSWGLDICKTFYACTGSACCGFCGC